MNIQLRLVLLRLRGLWFCLVGDLIDWKLWGIFIIALSFLYSFRVAEFASSKFYFWLEAILACKAPVMLYVFHLAMKIIWY